MTDNDLVFSFYWTFLVGEHDVAPLVEGSLKIVQILC